MLQSEIWFQYLQYYFKFYVFHPEPIRQFYLRCKNQHCLLKQWHFFKFGKIHFFWDYAEFRAFQFYLKLQSLQGMTDSKTWSSAMYYVVRIVNLFKCLESSISLFISRYFITDLNYNAACIFNLGTWGSLLKQHHCGKTFFEYIEPIINNLEILSVKRCNF